MMPHISSSSRMLIHSHLLSALITSLRFQSLFTRLDHTRFTILSAKGLNAKKSDERTGLHSGVILYVEFHWIGVPLWN